MSAQRSGLSKEEFKCVESRCLLLRVPIKRGSLGGGLVSTDARYALRKQNQLALPRTPRR